MLSKETFCEALRKIQAPKDRDEQFRKARAMKGHGHFVFEGGPMVLAPLLARHSGETSHHSDSTSFWLHRCILGT